MMLLPLWLACALGGKEAIQQAIVPLPVGDHGMVLTAWGQSGSSSKALTERNQDGATTANARSQSQGDETFGFEKLHRLHLTLATNQWVALQNTKGGGPFGRPGGEETAAVGGDAGPSDFHRTGMTEFPWAHVQLAEEGRVYTNVAVRYKGSFTFMASRGQLKKSLKVEFDHYDKDAPRFHGLRKFNLHAGILDPAKLREAFSYAVFRDGGVPAPRTAFAEVTLTVPGKYYHELLGLFTLTEQVDKQFLNDRFGDAKGLLLKPQLRGPDYFGERWKDYNDRYHPDREPSADEMRRIIAFANFVNRADDEEFRRRIASELDLPGFLRFLAVSALLVNLDSPLAMPQNYYLYLDATTHKFIFFPWDLDLGMAAWPMGGPPEQQMSLSLLHPHIGEHKLIDRLLGIPSVKEQYLNVIKELAAGVFSKAKLLQAIEAIERTTREPLAREVNATAARNERTGGFLPGGGMSAPAPRTFVEKRTESVAAQLAGKSTGYVPALPFGPGGGPGGPGGPRGPGGGPWGRPGERPDQPGGPAGPTPQGPR
jgi:hypothetical protein